MTSALRQFLLLALITLFTAVPERLFACAVCFGDPESPLVQGAKWGVIALGITVYCVLFAMAAIAYVWYRRARALEEQELEMQEAG